MKKYIKGVVVLTAICAVISLFMAGIDMLTGPIIAKNNEASANAALLVVMPEGKGFERLDISQYTLPSTVTGAHKEQGGGYVIELQTSGYSSGMKIMCGINADGEITGATCLSSGETLGYEKTYGSSLVGASADNIDEADTIAGATKTTAGYKNAVKDALNAALILNGDSVDIRTDEEILLDNLSSALPGANGEFEEIFIVEELPFVDQIYSAKNGSGFVYVSGESFVGIDGDGNVLSEHAEELKSAVENAYGIMSASRQTEVDISAMELPSNILKVKKTDTGNYVFELKASGFGINGDEWYNPSGEFIYISMAATSSGKIISIKTTSQRETDGIGSACADKQFYQQFIGKTDADYKDIDAIAGATITTNGYKTAVGRALEAIKTLKGAN